MSAPRVVVSAGTDIHPFERLMDWVERWIAVDLQPSFPWRRHAPLMALDVENTARHGLAPSLGFKPEKPSG